MQFKHFSSKNNLLVNASDASMFIFIFTHSEFSNSVCKCGKNKYTSQADIKLRVPLAPVLIINLRIKMHPKMRAMQFLITKTRFTLSPRFVIQLLVPIKTIKLMQPRVRIRHF